MASMTPASTQYFKQVASSWDDIRKGYFGEAVRDTAIKKAYLHPSMVVADIGAGTGYLSAGLAPLVRRVYVVDGSDAMLNIARNNLVQFQNIEYHEADGLNLPFPEESLDAVFANMYLHHCEDPIASIQEMVRILRPGGRLVITDMDSHPYAWLKEEMADVWQGFARSDIQEWFRAAGLVNLIVQCTGQNCCAQSSSPELREENEREANISVFLATGTKRMHVREAVETTYAGYATRERCGCSSASNACCNSDSESDCCSPEAGLNLAPGYTAADINAAPGEAAQISLGCGNPTAMANLKPGETVVDIGSGGGLDSFIAAVKVGSNGQVIGVDMTPAMLDRARKAAEHLGSTNVEFRQGFAEDLPVIDETVDVVMSNCVINLTEDKGQVFREAFRVLQPGGRLEVSDIVASGSLPIEAREDTNGWSECITGALPEAEYLELIGQAGFESITTLRSTSEGSFAGVPVYSIYVSAQKPGAERHNQSKSCCG